MSQSTGAHTTFARRWRAIYDVALGVTLFVSLLLPAVHQASTGTVPGLRNGMLLLLLDVVVLVMLSRYITRPSRQASRRHDGAGAEADEVLSAERVRELLDARGAPTEATGLTFTDEGIVVHQLGSPSHATLAWSDCAAVVHSRIALPNGTTFGYLQFVAVHEQKIRRAVRDTRATSLSRLLGLTESAASMVWVVVPQLVRLTPLVLAYVEQHHPHVRVVRPDVIEHAE